MRVPSEVTEIFPGFRVPPVALDMLQLSCVVDPLVTDDGLLAILQVGGGTGGRAITAVVTCAVQLDVPAAFDVVRV